jgi:hypothetical protein
MSGNTVSNGKSAATAPTALRPADYNPQKGDTACLVSVDSACSLINSGAPWRQRRKEGNKKNHGHERCQLQALGFPIR